MGMGGGRKRDNTLKFFFPNMYTSIPCRIVPRLLGFLGYECMKQCTATLRVCQCTIVKMSLFRENDHLAEGRGDG